jgi:CRP/FNR family transcriptional regulator, cyclic AMP receptor protein
MIDTEIKDALKTAQPFKYLNDAELNMLIQHSNIASFNSGDVILQQGKKSVGLYIIINGIALVKAKSLGKEAVDLLTIEHGNFVGEIGVLEKDVYATTVIANTPLQTLLIPIEYFDMLAAFFPETKYKISKSITEEICNRLKIISSRITDYMSHAQMMHLSLYEELIQSLSLKKIMSFEEAHIDIGLLKKMDFFKLLTDDEFSFLLKNASLIMTPQNYHLRKEGELEPMCGIILQGAVQSSINQSNKVAKLSILGPGKLFGSLSMINNSPSIINYTTREKTLLLQISQSNIHHIQSNHVQLWYKMYELICKSFVQLERMANKLDIRLNIELYNR